MANTDLEKYIQNARSQKVSDEEIKIQLVKSGWAEDEVAAALTPQSEHSVNLPPPPVPHFGMWVGFQYIILFICLYVSFSSLGGILHYAVDKNITDTLDKTNYNYGSYFNDYLLKGYLAGIIVTFPIFITLFLLLKRQAILKPAIKNLRSRKLLIYLTLVGSFVFMVGHLIATIYSFLSGTTTTRSFAHLGVTFVVAGSVFFYLLAEVRSDRKAV